MISKKKFSSFSNDVRSEIRKQANIRASNIRMARGNISSAYMVENLCSDTVATVLAMFEKEFVDKGEDKKLDGDVEILYEGNYLTLVSRDGWEYMTRSNATGVVFVLPVTDDGEIVLIEQFRPPSKSNVIEICAGLAGDVGEETMEEAARRELVEECGYEAGKMRLVCEGPIAQGSSDTYSYFFIATDLKKVGKGGGDSTEDITVHVVPLDELDEFVSKKKEEGKMIDPKMFAALNFLKDGEE